MKEKKYLFLDIISALFLLVMLLGNFLGFLYITGGNFGISFLFSAMIIVIYYFTIQQLKKYKEQIVNRKYMHPSSLLFLVFILGGIGSGILMSHAFNIETNVKKDIQNEARNKIDKLKEIPKLYNDKAKTNLQDYEGYLTKTLNDYKGNNSSRLRDSLNNPPYNIDSKILESPQNINTRTTVEINREVIQKKIEENKKDLKEKVEEPLNEFSSTFNDWEWVNIMRKYRELNDFHNNSFDLLNKKIEELPIRTQSVNYEKASDLLPLNKPFELNKKYKPNYLYPGIFLIILTFIILIPYFFYPVRKYVDSEKIVEGERNGAYII